MREKTKIFIQTLVLVLSTVFVIRLVLVSVHNGAVFADAEHRGKCISASLSNTHSFFRHIQKEASNFTVLITRIIRMKASFFLENHLNPVMAFNDSLSKYFHVLKI